MTDITHNQLEAHSVARQLDSAAWGLFLVWIGIALLTGMSWGVGLLGVGIITLGVQLIRRYMGLSIETFWLVVGLLFVVGGLWEMFNLRLGVTPILFILAGAALLVSAARKSAVSHSTL